jgi:hypothetical protein
VIPFNLPWWLWLILSLGLGWIAAEISDTNWGAGSGRFVANAGRLLFIIAAVLCGMAGVALLVREFWFG